MPPTTAAARRGIVQKRLLPLRVEPFAFTLFHREPAPVTENLLDRQLEEPRDPEGEGERRIVLAASRWR